MNGAGDIISNRVAEEGVVHSLRQKFRHFLSLLEQNHQALELISALEEKAQGGCPFDPTTLREHVSTLERVIGNSIENLIALSGQRYGKLRENYERIYSALSEIFTPPPAGADVLILPFSQLSGEQAPRVGYKNARLAVLKNHLGLPVPEGFAITAWASQIFFQANDLPQKIRERQRGLNCNDYERLVAVSEELQSLVRESPVPEEVAAEIARGREELRATNPADRYVLRSSAVGEDSELSFAGQYATFLNVPGEDLVWGWREVLASRFSPRALFYFLNQALLESEFPMAVGCLKLVAAKKSGVIYTRDPTGRPEIVITSIFGLGPLLMEGHLTPDEFRVSVYDHSLRERRLAVKAFRLVPAAGGGLLQEEVPVGERENSSLTEEELRELVECGLRIERYYQCPQEIEWAIDGQGELFFLQTRPLRIVEAPAQVVRSCHPRPLLREGGTTICPGAGGGPVFIVNSSGELGAVPRQAVLVTPHPFPGLVTVMDKISALVTEVGGVASHVATLARERRLPALAGVEKARELPGGEVVTVDATQGVIYGGLWPELVTERMSQPPVFAASPHYKLLKQVLAHVSPLHLLYPGDPNFRPENCQTFHDLTRFVHQKAMEEMFAGVAQAQEEASAIPAFRLKSEVPLEVNIIYLDQEPPGPIGGDEITMENISSHPMKHFWEGVEEENRPRGVFATDLGFRPAIPTILTKTARGKFSQRSFAFLGREYMNLSLHMGYHFSTVEAMCTPEPDKNYIRFQYKDGGATFDRRVRRVHLLNQVLSRMGFECREQGDFLDASLAYFDATAIVKKLFLLGRLTMMTKQLDMALSTDAISEWYTEDCLRLLGLDKKG